MKIYIFKKSKEAKPCGNAQHIYVPNQMNGNKVVGLVIADSNENMIYQHAQLKKCSDCAMIQMLE